MDANKEAFFKICNYATEHDKPFGFNLSALFIIDVYLEDLKNAFKNVDYLFCNEDESSKLAEKFGLEATDREGIAK